MGRRTPVHARDREPGRRGARCRWRSSARGEPRRLPPIVGRGAYRVVRDALDARRATEASVAIEFMPGALAVQVDDDGDGAATSTRSPTLAAALGGGLQGRPAAGRLQGAGVASDRRPAAVSRSAARSALSAGPPRAAAPDRAEHRPAQRRLGDVAHDDAEARGRRARGRAAASPPDRWRPARAASAGRWSGGGRRARTRPARGRRGSSARRSGCRPCRRPTASSRNAASGTGPPSAASGCPAGSITRNSLLEQRLEVQPRVRAGAGGTGTRRRARGRGSRARAPASTSPARRP